MCRNIVYRFKNDRLVSVESPHIKLSTVTDVKVINGAVYLYDDFNEEIGYVKSMY